MGKLLNQGLYN